MALSGSSGMLSKGGKMTGAALVSASRTAAALLLRGGVAMSMSSGCARKKPVKSLDGATWRPNTDSVDIMLQSLLDSDGSRSNTAAGILSGSPASSAPLLSDDESRSMSCVGGGEAGAALPRSSALEALSCRGNAMRAPVTDLDATGAAPVARDDDDA
jgi:hypothetical protein